MGNQTAPTVQPAPGSCEQRQPRDHEPFATASPLEPARRLNRINRGAPPRRVSTGTDCQWFLAMWRAHPPTPRAWQKDAVLAMWTRSLTQASDRPLATSHAIPLYLLAAGWLRDRGLPEPPLLRAMAGHSALTPLLARFLARPLVRRPFPLGRLCWRSRAACFGPSTRSRDPLWPPDPPTPGEVHPGFMTRLRQSRAHVLGATGAPRNRSSVSAIKISEDVVPNPGGHLN
jgi:hypothetical protein